MLKELNACYDSDGILKCATSYDDWCESCPNLEFRRKINIIEQSEVEE